MLGFLASSGSAPALHASPTQEVGVSGAEEGAVCDTEHFSLCGCTWWEAGPNNTLLWTLKFKFHIICTSRNILLYIFSQPLKNTKIISVCW